MNIIDSIPASNTDGLLRERGFDLLREYLDIIHQSAITSGFVVELATGPGRAVAILARLGFHVLTGDISSEKHAEVLRRLGSACTEKVSIMLLNMEHLPFRDSSIRNILCLNTVHELQHPHRCLAELRRVHHPDGVLIIGDFSERGFDVMDEVHRVVYSAPHERGNLSMEEVTKELTGSYRSCSTIETPLNVTLVLSGKLTN